MESTLTQTDATPSLPCLPLAATTRLRRRALHHRHPSQPSHLQLEDVYKEVFRVLKPGGMFATYEWVATKRFDPANPAHVKILDDINFGNGLPVSRPAGVGAGSVALPVAAPRATVAPAA